MTSNYELHEEIGRAAAHGTTTPTTRAPPTATTTRHLIGATTTASVWRALVLIWRGVGVRRRDMHERSERTSRTRVRVDHDGRATIRTARRSAQAADSRAIRHHSQSSTGCCRNASGVARRESTAARRSGSVVSRGRSANMGMLSPDARADGERMKSTTPRASCPSAQQASRSVSVGCSAISARSDTCYAVRTR